MNAAALAHASWAHRANGASKLALAFGLFVPLAFARPAIALVALLAAIALVVSVGAARRLTFLLWILPGSALYVGLLMLPTFLGPAEGLRVGTLFAARVAGSLALGVWFAATTRPGDLVAAFARFPRASLALAATMRGAQTLAEEAEAIGDAVALRGLGRVEAARAALPALLVRTGRRGATLGAALTASGFGPRRVSYARAAWRGLDLALVVAGIACALGGLLR
ncbi:MAG: CbiQ family ECF transporter T component [Thermoplasmatota archaeon]